MSEPKATIVHKLPKQLVPEDYLKLVMAENKVGFGFAGQEGGKIVIENNRAIMMSEVQELQKLFKDQHLVMYFTNGGVVPDDVMPYTVTNGKEDDDIIHYLAMFYEGDFEKYAKMDGEHAGVYCVYDAEIAPKIGNLYVENGKDWAKTFEAMKAEKWQRIIGNYFTNRGAFVILPPTGDPVCFGNNDIGGQFQWGNVSNRHGYTAKAEVPVKEEEDNGGLSFLRGAKKLLKGTTAVAEPKAEPAPTPAPVVEPAEEQPPSEGKPTVGDPVKAKPEDIETKVVNGVTLTKMRPPPAIRGNKKAKNAWFRTFNHGKLDEEVQRNQYVWVEPDLMPYAQRLVATKDQIEKMQTEISKLKRPPVAKAEATASTAAEILGKGKPTDHTKPVRETVAEAAAASAAAKSPADFLPVLDDNQREKALAKMAAFTSKGKQLTGLEVQKMEARWPTFSEDIGVDFEKDLMPRPVDDLVELFDGNKIAACAYIEMRHEVYRMRSLMDANKLDYTKPVKEKVEAKVEPAKADDGGGLSFLRGKSKSAA